MNKTVGITLGVGVVVALSVGAWWWMSGSTPAQPPAPIQPIVLKPPEIQYVPVEQYQENVSQIKANYESDAASFGATTQLRLGQKEAWAGVVKKATDRLLLLSIPAEDRENAENRIIAFLSLSQALKAASPDAIVVAKQEAEIAKTWK